MQSAHQYLTDIKSCLIDTVLPLLKVGSQSYPSHQLFCDRLWYENKEAHKTHCLLSRHFGNTLFPDRKSNPQLPPANLVIICTVNSDNWHSLDNLIFCPVWRKHGLTAFIHPLKYLNFQNALWTPETLWRCVTVIFNVHACTVRAFAYQA